MVQEIHEQGQFQKNSILKNESDHLTLKCKKSVNFWKFQFRNNFKKNLIEFTKNSQDFKNITHVNFPIPHWEAENPFGLVKKRAIQRGSEIDYEGL